MIRVLVILAMSFGIQLVASGADARSVTTYFSCEVNEPNVVVTVRFAIKDLDVLSGKGELVTYPGSDEEAGAISVSPAEHGGKMTMMSNLNGQGGDLRVLKNGDLHLFGDGAGYQFTDLVLWDDGDEDRAHTEGYVRDYGPTYGSEETFKQFIKCKRSTKRFR